MILFGDGNVTTSAVVFANILAVLSIGVRLCISDKELRMILTILFYTSFAFMAVGLAKMGDLKLSILFFGVNVIAFGLIAVIHRGVKRNERK